MLQRHNPGLCNLEKATLRNPEEFLLGAGAFPSSAGRAASAPPRQANVAGL